MAVINSGNLALKVGFVNFSADWIRYDINLMWNNEPVISEKVQKRTNKYWQLTSDGGICARDYEEDGLIPVIKKVLDTDESDSWTPIEPDVSFLIYCGDCFQFFNSDKCNRNRSSENKFTILVDIDTYNFKNSKTYSGDGVIFNLIVNRADLEKFVKELQEEYEDLLKKKDEE